MAVNYALIKDNRVVNVAVFDETVWDFDAWTRFGSEYDELREVLRPEGGAPELWIGWTRPNPDTPFAAPPRSYEGLTDEQIAEMQAANDE